MSTYIYLRCRDHDMDAPEESGQHWYDVPRVRADITMREHLVEHWDAMRNLGLGIDSRRAHFGYFTYNSVQFFVEHRECIDFGIITETGAIVATNEDVEAEVITLVSGKYPHRYDGKGWMA